MKRRKVYRRDNYVTITKRNKIPKLMPHKVYSCPRCGSLVKV